MYHYSVTCRLNSNLDWLMAKSQLFYAIEWHLAYEPWKNSFRMIIPEFPNNVTKPTAKIR